MKLSLEGSLSDLTVVELFQLIAMGNKTGVLEIHSHEQNNTGYVYFDNGTLTHIVLDKNVARLRDLLIKAGFLTEEQADQAHEYQNKLTEKIRYGKVLLDLNLISRHNLKKILHQQMEEAIYNIMEWPEGSFKFKDLAEIEKPDFPLGAKADAIILEGSRRIDEWSLIRKVIPDLKATVRLKENSDEGSQFLDLEPEEWNLIASIDGQKSVQEISLRQGLSNFDTCKLLLTLYNKNLIEIVPNSGKSGD